MKKIALALALALLPISAAGCAQLAGLTQNEQVATYDEKALLTLEDLYGFALDRVIIAGRSGLIDQDAAAKLVPLLDNVEAAVKKARKLYADGAALEASDTTAAVFAALAQLTAALKAAGL